MDTVDILKLYFKNEKIESISDELYNELKLQNLAQYLYYVLKDNKSIGNYYLKCQIVQEKYLHLQEELSSILNEAKIKHTFIKGSVLCTIYPDKALRTRGDIDILIIDDNFDKALSVLKNNNYLKGDSCYHHIGFTKYGLEIELHRHILSSNYKNNTYFDNLLKFNLVNEYEYRLDETIHYLYALWHFHKHVITGEGIRYLLDFYYMQKNWDLDYDFINKELINTNLSRFHTSIMNGVYIITGEKLWGFDNENDFKLINLLRDSGIHGRNTNPTENLMSANSKSKFYYICDRLFLFNKLERQTLYPRLSKSIFFYPILLTHRSCHLLFTRLKSLKRYLNFKKNDDRNNLLSEIGVIEL